MHHNEATRLFPSSLRLGRKENLSLPKDDLSLQVSFHLYCIYFIEKKKSSKKIDIIFSSSLLNKNNLCQRYEKQIYRIHNLQIFKVKKNLMKMCLCRRRYSLFLPGFLRFLALYFWGGVNSSMSFRNSLFNVLISSSPSICFSI